MHKHRAWETRLENHFQNDAHRLFRLSAAMMSDRMDSDTLLNATLLFGLAVERALKAILWKVNPAYVFEETDFKNTAAVLYKVQLHESDHLNKYKGLNMAADGVTVAYGIALERAKCFSAVASHHTSKLYWLKKQRDIIAHKELRELPKHDELKSSVLHYFERVASDFSSELTNHWVTFYNSKKEAESLRRLSQKHGPETEHFKRMFARQLLVFNRKTPAELAAAQAKIGQYSHVWDPCPACGKQALLDVEVEYEHDVGDDYFETGAYVSRLHCPFCELEITDPDDIDSLGLNDAISR